MPRSQAMCHSHVFFHRKLNPAEILCIYKCPPSLEAPLGPQSFFSWTRALWFLYGCRCGRQMKQRAAPWCCAPAGQGHQHPPLPGWPASPSSHGPAAGGHCLWKLPGIEWLGNRAREGLPRGAAMPDRLAPWFNSSSHHTKQQSDPLSWWDTLSCSAEDNVMDLLWFS